MSLEMPPFGMAVFRTLTAAGFDAWFVGGYVRDAIMGREAHDVDIATSAHWKQVQTACEAAGFATHETGTKHGTLTVVPDGTNAVEVTTFRTDGAYKDGRHPESVEFVATIEKDLARRDFTMNALAYQPGTGLFDPMGGLEDIERRTIRVVGDPKQRFKEDALRILRACRFASQLGFAIEPETLSAMHSLKHLMSQVSQERKTHELDELLQGDHVHDAIMATADVLAYVLPELVAMKDLEQHTKYHCYDVLEHTAWAVQFAAKDRLVRWAALCHDMGKPAAMILTPEGVGHFYGHAAVSAELARGVGHRMLMSGRFVDELALIISLHSEKMAATKKSVRKFLAKLNGNVELFRAYVQLKRADAAAHAPAYAGGVQTMDDVLDVLDEVLASAEAFNVDMLAVDGRDLLDAGMAQGPALGEMLAWLLNEVIEERMPNERAALMAAAEERMREETDAES